MSAHKQLTRKDLSPDQLAVYDGIVAWLNEPQGIMTVGGYAGTGKTSILGVFAAETKLLVAYATFTGRASSVLQRKLAASRVATTTKTRAANGAYDARFQDPRLKENSGPAFVGTLHKLLYIPVIDPVTEEVKGWKKRDKLDRNYDLIVVDEASMVGDSLLLDLKNHGVPILAVGDHGQLPPVADSGELMQEPMLRLEKIHRQARGNPIIGLAHAIRETGKLEPRFEDAKHIAFRRKKDIDEVLRDAFKEDAPFDVGLLCWMNKTRIKLNGSARAAAGFSKVPSRGEIVMALKNMPPVYNGMRGVLTGNGTMGSDGSRDELVDGVWYPGAEAWHLEAPVEFPDEGLPPTLFRMCAPQFNRERVFESVDEAKTRMPIRSLSEAGAFFDFGYAMTVHKSQGSSFRHVVFFLDRAEKPWDEEWRRFAYTAVTRASERLTVVA